jgi:5-formyltetrahydrofolate cyclo-ligase
MERSTQRTLLRAARRQLTASARAQYSRAAAIALLQLGFFRSDQRVGLYLAGPYEADPVLLRQVLIGLGVRVYLPRCIDQANLEFRRYTDADQLEPDARGLLAPSMQAERVELESLAVIVMPVLGFDPFGNRLGSGAGYYDRALQQCQATKRIGLAFECQKLARIDSATWDVPMHALATEAALHQF